MNYQQLQDAVVQYLHRDDMTAMIITALAIANVRIGQNLRHSSNLISNTINIQQSPVIVPADLRELRTLSYPATASNPQIIPIVSQDQIGQFSNSSGGSPVYAAMTGNSLSVWPVVVGDYQITYYGEPAQPVLPADENPVMAALPQLYIYGALMESFFITQDGDLTAYARKQFGDEIQAANLQMKQIATGTRPAMRRLYGA